MDNEQCSASNVMEEVSKRKNAILGNVFVAVKSEVFF